MNGIFLRKAQVADIDEILKLHYRYQINSIREEDKKDGFITTAFTEAQLKDLITLEQGIFLAIKDNKIVAYVMSASWKFWCQWPIFAYMAEELPNLQYKDYTLSVQNSYQYGPVCVDQSVRGLGVLEEIFSYALKEMNQKYPVLVTFINQINLRSFTAHTRKIGLDVIHEFEYNNNQYYELACLTDKMI